MIYVVEINLICLCILLFTLRSVLTRDERNVSMSFYKWCIVCASISILSDIAFQFIENSGLSFLQNVPFLNYCVNLIYYVAAVATSYFWSMYAEYSIDGWAKNYKHAAKLLAIPVAINVVLGIMSYWNGILFKINADGCYERGSMFYINTISCYLYTFAVSIHALAKSIKATNVMKKKEYRIIATYVLFPFVLGIIQIIFPEVPSVCLGMSLPILYVHTQLQDLKISTDYLTNLNNRNQLMRYLNGRFRGTPTSLYIFMMDVDKFKTINDTYGHTEGDNALISVADKLKEVAHQYGGIIARFGGDEFTLATDVPDDNTDAIKDYIAAKMIEASERHEFDIRLSVGSAKYQPGMKVSDLFAAADAELYKEKERKKTKR